MLRSSISFLIIEAPLDQCQDGHEKEKDQYVKKIAGSGYALLDLGGKVTHHRPYQYGDQQGDCPSSMDDKLLGQETKSTS